MNSRPCPLLLWDGKGTSLLRWQRPLSSLFVISRELLPQMLGSSFQILISLCWPCGSVFKNTFSRYFVKIYLVLRGRVGSNCLGHCYWKQKYLCCSHRKFSHSFDTKRSKLQTNSLWQPDFVILYSEYKWDKKTVKLSAKFRSLSTS